jgi:hypothetical protein
MSEYTIRPYVPADDAGLAVMWNESDDQWPGTFTEGVPMTEERVREGFEGLRAEIAYLIVGDSNVLKMETANTKTQFCMEMTSSASVRLRCLGRRLARGGRPSTRRVVVRPSWSVPRSKSAWS